MQLLKMRINLLQKVKNIFNIKKMVNF